MPTTVYTLLCQTDRTGQVLGVFADRVHAAEIARSCAATHAEKLRRQDQQTFKAPVAADIDVDRAEQVRRPRRNLRRGEARPQCRCRYTFVTLGP